VQVDLERICHFVRWQPIECLKAYHSRTADAIGVPRVYDYLLSDADCTGPVPTVELKSYLFGEGYGDHHWITALVVEEPRHEDT